MNERIKRPGQNKQLSNLDDLFGTTAGSAEEQQIKKIPITSLLPHSKQYRNVIHDDHFMDLVNSIDIDGQIVPIIVRPHGNIAGKYEILAGHHRTVAHKHLSLDTIDAIIVDVDDNTADIVLVQSNIQKMDMIPSEKAKGYLLYMEVNKKRGFSSNDYLKRAAVGISTRAELAELQGVSETSIQRYIRLNYLIPQLLELVDMKKIKVAVGESLSFLSEYSQKMVSNFLDLNSNMSVDYSQASDLRKYDTQGELTPALVENILLVDKSPTKTFKRSHTEKIYQYFDDNATEEEITNIIVDLLEKYHTR